MFKLLKSIVFNLWDVPNIVPKEYADTLLKRIFLRIDAYIALILHGATKYDYKLFEFYKLGYSERKKFITYFRGIYIDRICVPKKKRNIMNDKIEFNKRYSAFIKREYLSVNDVSDPEIKDFISRKKRVIVKPIGLCFGQGIFITESTNQSVNNLLEVIKTNRDYLIEEILQNCKEISIFSKSSLNTFRVVMIKDRKGVSHIIKIVLRMGASNACVDNAHSGGISVSVNAKTGIIDSLGKDMYGNEYIEHPISQIKLLGYQIPRIEELKDFAYKLMDVEPSIRYVGWDIAMLEDRCEVIEGNRRPGEDITQMCNNIPKYNIIKKYL